MTRAKRPLLIALSLGCSALILWSLSELSEGLMWSELSLTWLWGVALCSLLVLLARAARLALLVGCGLGVALKVSATQGAMLRALPMRLGELSLPYLLKRWLGVSVLRGGALLVWVRLSELFTLGVMALLALSAHLSDLDPLALGESLSPSTLLITLGALISLSFVALTLTRPTLVWLTRRSGRSARLRQHGERLLHELPQLTPKLTLTLVSFALLIFSLQLALFGACLATCGLYLPLSALTLGASSAHLSGVLPLPTVGNIGSHELGWVVGFMWVGVSQAEASLSALVSQLSTLALAVLWWALVSALIPSPRNEPEHVKREGG